MSNTLAIAAVTTALYNRLHTELTINDSELSGMSVKTQPMDQAFEVPTGIDPVGDCLNIFLYHVVPSASFRNRPAPLTANPGETGSPPLALTLHYMISAHGQGADDVRAHRILGRAMACLHDRPLLDASELAALTGSDAHLSVERVRITEQPLTTEEMYKLWSAFQTHYRVSAAYEVSVVLIDSARPVKAPLPVARLVSLGNRATTNAPDDIVVLVGYPTLTAVTPPGGRDYALSGDELTLSGSGLIDDSTATVTALFSHPLLPAVVRQSISVSSEGAIKVQIPDEITQGGPTLPAGVYTLSLEISWPTEPDKPVIITNALPFVLAPQITLNSNSVALAGGVASIEVTVGPKVWPEQRVYLLVGSTGFTPDPIPSVATESLTFPAAVAAGDYYLRLRVDGVDSPLVVPGPPPAFDTTKKITITAS